jgi:prevent-host-death family protein
MWSMREVRIGELQQNAAAVVGEVAAGHTVTITDRGRPVAQMTPVPKSRLQALIDSGRARPARRRLTELAAPAAGPSLSGKLRSIREDQRY